MKYPQGVKALKAKVNKVNTQGRRNVKTFVYWGGAGTGKTSSVIKKYGQNNVYTLDKSKNEVWFDGYDQEKSPPNRRFLWLDTLGTVIKTN